jgi:hypothetical protein
MRNSESEPKGAGNASDESLGREGVALPVAIPCVLDSQDARKCPQCGRTFRMQDRFAGKVIRCRGCKVIFRVTATEAIVHGSYPKRSASDEADGSEPLVGSARPPLPPPVPPGVARTLADDETLKDQEDVGQPLRVVHVQSASPGNPLITVLSVAFGGLCAIPLALIVLRFISEERFRYAADALPGFLVDWLR